MKNYRCNRLYSSRAGINKKNGLIVSFRRLIQGSQLVYRWGRSEQNKNFKILPMRWCIVQRQTSVTISSSFFANFSRCVEKNNSCKVALYCKLRTRIVFQIRVRSIPFSTFLLFFFFAHFLFFSPNYYFLLIFDELHLNIKPFIYEPILLFIFEKNKEK